MGFPKDIGIIDCMLGIPEAEDRSDWFTAFRPLIKDAQTLQQFAMPAQYMFKDIPQTGQQDDYIKWTVDQMDKHNVQKALVGWNENETSRRAKELYSDRFFFDLPCDPNKGMEEVRRIKRLKEWEGGFTITAVRDADHTWTRAAASLEDVKDFFRGLFVGAGLGDAGGHRADARQWQPRKFPRPSLQ